MWTLAYIPQLNSPWARGIAIYFIVQALALVLLARYGRARRTDPGTEQPANVYGGVSMAMDVFTTEGLSEALSEALSTDALSSKALSAL